MKRNFLKKLVVGIVLSFLCGSHVAFAYTSPGNPQGYVTDFAHVLTAEQHDRLEEEIEAYEARTTNEIAVVTVATIGKDTIEQYANSLFQEWGIGKKHQDNGVLVLFAIQDRKLRIEVGYGLESVLTDARSADFIQQAIPLLQEQKYASAMEGLTTNIELVLDRAANDQATQDTVQKSEWEQKVDHFVDTSPRGIVLGTFIVVGFILVGIARLLIGLVFSFVGYLFALLYSLITGKPRPKMGTFFRGSVRGAFFGGRGTGFGRGSSSGGCGGGSSGGGGASGGW